MSKHMGDRHKKLVAVSLIFCLCMLGMFALPAAAGPESVQSKPSRAAPGVNWCAENTARTQEMIDELLMHEYCRQGASPEDCRSVVGVGAGGAHEAVAGLAAAGLISTATEAHQRTWYVKSADELLRHMEAHRKCLNPMGKHLVKENKNIFTKITPELFGKFIDRVHDKSKVDKTLSMSNPKGTIIKRLFKFYGIESSMLSNEARTELTLLVKELNAIDQKVAMAFFRSEKLLNPDGSLSEAAEQLLRAEKIVDLVDRGMNPVSKLEEFGRTLSPASQFMRDPEDKRMARMLEKSYTKLTRGLEFIPKTARTKTGRVAFKALTHLDEALEYPRRLRRLMGRGLRSLSAKEVRRLGTALKHVGIGAAGPVGVAVNAAPILAESISTTACGNQIDGFVDYPSATNCRPITTEVTTKFSRFLKMSEDEQAKILRGYPLLCDHLQQVYSSVRKPPVAARCGDDHRVVLRRTQSGEPLEIALSDKRITVRSNQLSRALPFMEGKGGFFEFDRQGVPKAICVQSQAGIRGLDASDKCEKRFALELKDERYRVRIGKTGLVASGDGVTDQVNSSLNAIKRNSFLLAEVAGCCAFPGTSSPASERCESFGLRASPGLSRGAGATNGSQKAAK